jgi:hypothetical protein
MELSNLTTLLLILLAGIILYYINSSKSTNNASESEIVQSIDDTNQLESFVNSEMPIQDNVVTGATEQQVSEPVNIDKQTNEDNQYPNDCFPKDQLTPSDLLPGNANSKWAQVNPAGQGELGDQNFLNAGYHVGVNTVGQTLRNANLQLRSEPPNPQLKVSPWLQSTIEPDSNRKPMEIGGC